jgi:hypothetical protein
LFCNITAILLQRDIRHQSHTMEISTQSPNKISFAVDGGSFHRRSTYLRFTE